MALTNQDILFAALVGSKAMESVERFSTVQNELMKHVLPPIPFLPVRNQDGVRNRTNLDAGDYTDQELWQADRPLSEDQQFFPLKFSFRDEGPFWLFPYEPMITISSGNVIAESTVAKQGDAFRGTVKERWSMKDWDITITGVLIGSIMQGKAEDCFPSQKLSELFEFLIAAKSINVYNHALERLGILKIVIYDYSFPFTKGENVQAYELKCKSDDAFELLIDDE
jgi:hypothetical protein